MLIEELMTRHPITVKETTPLRDAALLLSSYRISGLPVVDDRGTMVGIISEFDLISRQGAVAGDIMTKSVITVTPETPVELVNHILTDHRIRRLPVLSEGKLVGIVSRSDIIRMMSHCWHCEVCGETVRREKAPENCPRCTANTSFAHALQTPGM